MSLSHFGWNSKIACTISFTFFFLNLADVKWKWQTENITMAGLLRGNPCLHSVVPHFAWSSAHTWQQQVGHPTRIIEGLACRLTLCILEQIICNFINSVQISLIQTLKLIAFSLTIRWCYYGKMFCWLIKTNNFTLGVGWVGCYLQRFLSAQIKCQHWPRKTANFCDQGLRRFPWWWDFYVSQFGWSNLKSFRSDNASGGMIIWCIDSILISWLPIRLSPILTRDSAIIDFTLKIIDSQMKIIDNCKFQPPEPQRERKAKQGDILSKPSWQHSRGATNTGNNEYEYEYE